MPLDPSIVSNAFANISSNMPDVNALMQQRVRGAENIYQIETARQAQAAEAEKEAAKAQEDAAVKALLPAYAHALKTGDLRGALKLAPPQYQDSLVPYMDALEGKPIEEIQAALTGSLVTSDVGRAFLENQSRLATLGVQQGQLDVSRQDLVLRRQKQALDARGEGNWDWKEGVDENGQPAYMWVNPRTRQVVPADITGGAAPGAIPAPDVVTPRQPMPGAPEVAPPPAGVAQPPAGVAQPPAFRPKPKAASTEQTQEERRRAAAVRYSIKNVDKVLQTIDKDPASFGQGADEFFLSLVPFGAAEDFKSFVQDANRQQVYYRMNQTVATMLRLATGAAYTSPELVTEANSFMPKYGDAAATARDKLDALEDRILSEVGSTGRGFTPEDQADLDKLLDVFATMKDKVYPVGVEAVDAGEVDTSNPLLKDEE
jgi:hypothetical protein